ncbi:hypothetical protein EZS27_011348 [termite gut metagenome]|uniref:DUF3408 domain-containing protein n=1 Tax=termite gut metagenome TaxID=433724 RepID=A0A5J4S606_9ZZZZ
METTIRVFAITKQSKESPQDYGSNFLKTNEVKPRQEKTRRCVYISEDVHAAVSEITRTLADRGVTMGSYIDNVLRQHLAVYRKDINKLYKRSRKDLI